MYLLLYEWSHVNDGDTLLLFSFPPRPSFYYHMSEASKYGSLSFGAGPRESRGCLSRASFADPGARVLRRLLITSFYYDLAALLLLTAAAFLPVSVRLARSPKPQVNHVLRTRESRSDTDGSIAVFAVVALQQKMCMSPSGGQHGGFLLRAASFPVKGNEAVLARFMCRLQTFLLCAGGAALRSGGGGFPSLVWSLSTIMHYFTQGFFSKNNTTLFLVSRAKESNIEVQTAAKGP